MFKLFPFTEEIYNTYVQIDKKHLKVMHIIYKGKRPAIKKLIVKPIIDMDEKAVAGALKEITHANSIPLNFITIIISREKAMVRRISLPAVDRQEIDSMVSFEITKQTPYSREEIVADYKILKSDEQGYSNVMLFVSPKTEIAKIHDIVKSAGGNPRRIVLSSEAMAGWFRFSEKRFAEKVNNCIVDIDHDSTEIMITSDKGLEFSRTVSMGASELQKGVNDMNSIWSRLVDEIKRSVSKYQKENQPDQENTTEFIVTGASSVSDSFNRFLSTAVHDKCIVLPVFSFPVLLEGALGELGVPGDVSVCAICGGAYLEKPINLMPDEHKIRHSYQSKFRKVIMALAALMVLFIIICSVLATQIYQKKQSLEQIRSIYSQIQPVVEQTEEKMYKLGIVKNYLSDGESSLEVIYNLYELMPPGISLVDFNYDDLSKAIRFNGRAGRMSDVFKLVTILEESGVFNNVQTHSVIQRQSRESASVEFQIRCSFDVNE
jgi:type IV pilus assembly protein PilM